MSDDILEKAQASITRGPYHQWLGLKVVAVHDDGIELTATWREEWVVNPERRYTHGGMLAALVDLAADWAMFKKLGRAGADHRSARRLSRRRDAGRPHRQGQGGAAGRAVLLRRSLHLRQGRQAPGLRPRHLFHRATAAAEGLIETAPMPDLHQSRRPDRPRPRHVEGRGDRSRRRASAARVQLCAARRHGERRRARADQARPRSRRPRSPSSPPTAPNISRPITASCAPASSRCR